jgi:hypothetical protein
MANLIRLKQIEGSTELQAAVSAGNAISQSGGSFTDAVSIAVSQSLETSLSASIINIITNNVAATLPDGVISSSAQIELVSASGYEQLATDIEVSVVSSSVAASITILSNTYVTTASLNIVSASLDGRVTSLENFSTSLDLTYATDAELAISQSNINVDMGEW